METSQHEETRRYVKEGKRERKAWAKNQIPLRDPFQQSDNHTFEFATTGTHHLEETSELGENRMFENMKPVFRHNDSHR